MTKAELKLQHPALVAEIENEAKAAAMETVNAWLAFSDIDSKAVLAGIGSGNAPSAVDVAQMQAAVIAASKNLETAEKDAPASAGAETPETGEAPGTEVDAKAKLRAELDALNGKK